MGTADLHKDFESSSRGSRGGRVTFTQKGRSFEALPDAPGQLLIDAARSAKLDEAAQIEATMAFLDEALTDESAARYAEGLRDKANPLTIDDAGELIEWLLTDVYGGGAGKADSSSSSAGPLPTGESSEAATPAPA